MRAEMISARVFKDSTAEVTGRLILQSAKELGVPITPEIAAPAVRRDCDRHRLVQVPVGNRRHVARAREADGGGGEPGSARSPVVRSSIALPRLHLRGRYFEQSEARVQWTG